jgi:scyllo-inositol 2-dehydrogenase (NAD+)
MINVGMLSKWHVHAKDYVKQASDIPNINIVMVWDEDPKRGAEWGKELGVPFEADLETVLSNDNIDAVIVDTPTSMHKDVIIAAAKHQKHIFTEKVLALTVSDCEEIFEAVAENNVQLMISLPRLSEDYYLYAEKALSEGLLGEITSIRCRVAHDGAIPFEDHPHGWLPKHFFDKDLCGGGALIDLGAHAIYLTNRLAGPAKAVTARLSNFLGKEVDDNAAVIVEYESGALGVLETGFVSNRSPFQLELYGTNGTLMIEDQVIEISSNKLKLNGWVTPNDVPKAIPMPMEQWVNAIEKGEKPFITNEDAYLLTQINQAAALSNKEKRRVEVKEL